jgi:hypothetical protein
MMLPRRLDAISKMQITPEGKAHADETAQQPRRL